MTFIPLRRLSWILTLLLLLPLGLQVMALLPAPAAEGIKSPKLDWLEAILVMYGVVLGMLVAVVAVVVAVVALVVAFFVWLRRAAHNARLISPGGTFHFTPASSVWWWFVPVANVVQPARAMIELVEKTEQKKEEEDPAPSPLVMVWWLSWLAAWAAPNFTQGPLVNVLGLVSAGSTIALVQYVTRLQHAWATR